MDKFLEISILPAVMTLAVFQIGRLCQKKWKLAIFNPTLIGSVLIIVVLLLTGMDTKTYNDGIKVLSWLMTPATISLAIPMYQQLQVLKKNWVAILAGIAAGAVASLVFLTLSGILLGLEQTITVSLMPKSVTTAIGMPLSELYGGQGGITTVAIIITGISANMLGSTFCKWFRIKDEIAQGVAFGTAGHVVGTARANELSPLTGAVSSLSLVVAGLLTAILFPLFMQLF